MRRDDRDDRGDRDDRDDRDDDGLYGLGYEEEDENGEPARRRYKVNKKRFAFVLVSFALILSCCVVIVLLISTAFNKETAPASSHIAAVNSPGNTASGDTASPDSSTPPDSPTPSKTPQAATDALKGKTIILDAGHGGIDPGSLGVKGTKEAELNLAVTQKLKTALEAMGAQITMTRSDSNAIAETKVADMEKRKQIIKDNKTDIAISIHMNSLKSDPSIAGPLTLFMTGSAKGKVLAEAIMQELNEALEPKSDGKARAESNLLILKSGYQPTVIVECGYISNAEEEEKLKQDDYQDQIVEAICKGVETYFATPNPT